MSKNSNIDKNTDEMTLEIISEIIKDPSLLTSDTRDLDGKKYFICFQGKNFDAHDFVKELLTNSDLKYIFVEKDIEIDSNKLFKVNSTLDFYHLLANSYRKLIDPKVIAVTGSSGKTTTKNLLKHVFETEYKVHATEANFNNEYGVPKTILSMPKDTEVLVLEMAMRGLGQIDKLTKTAVPNFAAITNIGTAHIELLGSRENIRKAKLEIINGFDAANDLNALYVNKDLASFITQNHEYMQIINDKYVEINVFGSYVYDTQPNFLVSDGVLEDMELVRMIAKDSSIDDEKIKTAIQSFEPEPGRGGFIFMDDINGKKNIIFIDETYNANLEAVKNSVAALKTIFKNDPKIVVLGAIKESDELEVEKLFRDLHRDTEIELVDARYFEHHETKSILDKLLCNGAVVFFKASRSEKLEELIALYR